jgi:glutaminase
VEDEQARGWQLFDLRRVKRLEPASVLLLVKLTEQLRAAGVEVVLVPPRSVSARRATAAISAAATVSIADADDALRWCEDALLAEHGITLAPAESLVPIAEQDLLVGLSFRTVSGIESAVVTRVFSAGTPIFNEGAASDGLYFVGAGQVSAVVSSGGALRRLSTMGPGASFGEIAFIEGSTRSTTVIADDATLCHVLTIDAFEKLIADDPMAAAELHRAIAKSLATRLRLATKEISVLDQLD